MRSEDSIKLCCRTRLLLWTFAVTSHGFSNKWIHFTHNGGVRTEFRQINDNVSTASGPCVCLFDRILLLMIVDMEKCL